MPLNPKQILFCQEYLIDLNGYQAAVRAGYAESSARSRASKLLSNVAVQEYLAEIGAAREERCQVDGDRVLQELCALAFSNITDVITISPLDISFKEEISLPAQLAIAQVTVNKSSVESDRGVSSHENASIKMHPKLPALRELGKHLGLFRELDGAIAVLSQYGSVEPTETGHVFNRSQA